MPALARLLLPLAAGALGYAAGRRWLPRVDIYQTHIWRPPGEGRYPNGWCVVLETRDRIVCGAQEHLAVALAVACADWWREARRAACPSE